MFKKVKLGIFLVVVSLFIGIIGYGIILIMGNVMVDEKKLMFHSEAQMIHDNGDRISSLYLENHSFISIDEIPIYVQKAFVSIEDERFYNHHGLDFFALVRAFVKDILARSTVEGGSTITQQLAKNVFLTNEKTIWRKIKEVAIALNLERNYTKNEILEMYLNAIYFGHGMYGIESASRYYFNKVPSQLTVDEGAVLAALPKAPNHYSPIRNSVGNRQRRNIILSKMISLGVISQEEGERLKKKSIMLQVTPPSHDSPYLTYIDMVFKEAREKYGITEDELVRGGYQVYVSLNEKLQKRAYERFKNSKLFPGVDESVEGAFVLMNNKTGSIEAAIGGRHYQLRSLNRIFVKRQPGSTLKPPLVYAPALETKEYNPYSLLENEQMTFGRYAPRNHDNQYSKNITMYDAIKYSANIPAVWLLDQIGIDEGKKYLRRAGIYFNDRGLSAALGGLTEGISPFDMMKIYRAFAMEGKIVEPHIINKIVDRDGQVIAIHEAREKQIYSKQTAWYMTKMLRSSVREGTARAGNYKQALAGKTGTTNFPLVENGARDAWFVGYTPTHVGALWSGYDRTDEAHYLAKGSSVVTALFKDLLKGIEGERHVSFTIPSGVIDLDEPILLPEVKKVKSYIRFSLNGFFVNHLTWKAGKDKRVEYRIYEKKGDKKLYIDTVIGKGSYDVKFINILAPSKYMIVPYNPLTGEEGNPSFLTQ